MNTDRLRRNGRPTLKIRRPTADRAGRPPAGATRSASKLAAYGMVTRSASKLAAYGMVTQGASKLAAYDVVTPGASELGAYGLGDGCPEFLRVPSCFN